MRRRKRCWLAFSITGDLGLLTTWNSDTAGFTWMVKSPPKEPPTPAQVVHRARFKGYHNQWNALTQQQREDYELVTKLLKFYMTGKNFWLHCCFRGCWEEATRASTITGIPLFIP